MARKPFTAVATALKDDGIRSGDWLDVAFVAGAIIYDFGGRRFNEVYPDKRLAQAALRAARPGVFPLGAQGAGRMAMQGSYFGCNTHSGQGGAFRQIGAVKIAAFTVVNAYGAVTDRAGRLVACNRPKSWGNLTMTSELLRNLPQSLKADWDAAASRPDAGGTRNTTISLIVTNQKLDYASLQRMAVQVHTSMARAIQPFSTQNDGDTLYAASTQEIDTANSARYADDNRGRNHVGCGARQRSRQRDIRATRGEACDCGRGQARGVCGDLRIRRGPGRRFRRAGCRGQNAGCPRNAPVAAGVAGQGR